MALGVDEETATEDACRIEHVISAESFEAVKRWLEARRKMVRLMGRLRPMVLALHDETGHNTALFRALAQSPLQDHLQQGDRQACLRCLQALLPPKLHDRIPELLDVIA